MSANSRKPVEMFVFIDAMGWEIVEQNKAFSWLQTLRQPVRTILGYSSTCIPSILSGKLPQEHGHWTLFQKASFASELAPLRWLRWLPHQVSDHHRFRRYLSQFYQKYMNFTGYFNLYKLPYESMVWMDYTEKRDIFDPTLSDFRTIFHLLEEERVPYWRAEWRKDEEANVADFYARLEAGNTYDWIFHYFPKMDGIMHLEGPEGAVHRLPWYEETVQKMVQHLEEQGREVYLTIFSDHGMTPIEQHLDIASWDGTASLRLGKDYLALYDATLAHYWFAHDQAREQITAALADHPQGHWLSKDELRQEGLLFSDNRYGDACFLANPGVLLHPNHMGADAPVGMHGFSAADKHSSASILSNHPKAHEILGPSPVIHQFFDLMKQAMDSPARATRPLALAS